MKKHSLIGLLALVAGGALALGEANSGLKIGEAVTPFNPTHISGPDAGTTKCPP